MIEYKKLSCGAGMVMEKMPQAQSACIGVWVGAGSVCENRDNSGVSHFIEHMFFKGTASRSARQVAEDIENLGASVNAFTGKEATCFHIKALTEVFPQAVDVLMDMLENSLFDAKEMNRERGVILEEMQMYEDTPDDQIIDLITEKTMAGTPLQSNIIGTRSSLRKIKRSTIISYIDEYYKPANMVVSVVGNFDEAALTDQLEKALSGFSGTAPEKLPCIPEAGRRFASRTKDIGQSHIALGIPTISLASDEYYVQAIVSDVLGGGMSSRLFQNVREQRGLAYTVFSMPMSYSQAGMFCIYAGISLGKEKEALDAIAFELSDLAAKGLDSRELALVKQRLKSGYIFGQESMNSRMHSMGKNRLLLGRNYSQEETMAEIDAVSLEQINEYCRRLGDINDYSAVIISRDKLNIKSMIS